MTSHDKCKIVRLNKIISVKALMVLAIFVAYVAINIMSYGVGAKIKKLSAESAEIENRIAKMENTYMELQGDINLGMAYDKGFVDVEDTRYIRETPKLTYAR